MLVVNGFRVKYLGEKNLNHLISVLKDHYEISINRDSKRYCGVFLDWDYKNQRVHPSMPGYVQKAFKCFNHTRPSKPQNQPYPHTLPKYGANVQYTMPLDTSPKLDTKDKKFIQEVMGT